SLADAGLSVGSLDDLKRVTVDQYRATIPLLIWWLPRIENFAIKEAVVRLLAVKWARPAALRPLLAEFTKAPMDQMELKWAIGNTFEVIADKSVADERLTIVQDKRHGYSRQMMILALGKLKESKAIDVIIPLLDDETIRTHAIIALGNLK